MLKLSHLNPEEPRQVVLRILMDSVQPYLSQAIGALFQRDGNPLSNLRKFLQKNAGQLAAAMTAAGTAGGATSAVALWKKSLKPHRALAYQMGITKLPLAAPILGGFVGLALCMGSAAVLVGRLRDSQALAMAKLHAQIFSVMLYAEGVDSTARQRILEELKDRLIGSGLKPDVVDSVFGRAPLRVEDLDLDVSSYEAETLRAVLMNAWQMAKSTGEVAPAAERAFRRLCARLHQGDDVAYIQEHAEKALGEQAARISATIETARHLGSDLDPAMIKTALDSLLLLDPLATANKRRLTALRVTSTVAAAAGAIAAVASGSGQILPIVGQAYAALQAATAGDDESAKRLEVRAKELLKHLGVKPEDATSFVEPLGEVLASLRHPAGEADITVSRVS